MAIRPIKSLPTVRRIAQVLVLAPEELIAAKLIAYHQRQGEPKAGTDWRDLAMLLLTFPDLKSESGPVVECLQTFGAASEVLSFWKEVVTREILPEDEDDDF